MEDLNHILLFKTNISNESCRAQFGAILETLKGVVRWNIALDDKDYVLRIVSYTLNHQEIIRLVNYHGYECSELNLRPKDSFLSQCAPRKLQHCGLSYRGHYRYQYFSDVSCK